MSSYLATVSTKADLARVVAEHGGGPHYVYVLHMPAEDGSPGIPFYVGIGQGHRLFSHEEQARETASASLKCERIREIWRSGGQVVRVIDSVHVSEPWDREEALINDLGRLGENAGPLTNAQAYSRSYKVDGVELRKYAGDYAATGDLEAIPPRFKLRDTRLKAGPRKPRSNTSVFGKIHATAEANPGVTGEQLVRLLQKVDFLDNKSAYTQAGRVSVSWLVGYIEGGYFRDDRQHLQSF